MSPTPAVILLMIVYMASLIGFTTPHQQAWYLYYTPYFILLNVVMLFLYQRPKDKAMALFSGGTFLVAITVEAIAVNTHTLYGIYSFGESLGPKIASVPWALPFLWLLILGSTAVIAAQLLPQKPAARVALGTVLSLGMFTLIAWVAPRLDFWFLEAGALWRYALVLGLVAALLQYLFVRGRVASDNRVAGYLYGGLLLFFVGVVSFLR